MIARLVVAVLLSALLSSAAALVAPDQGYLGVQAPPPVAAQTLQGELQGYVAGLDGTYGVAVLSLDDGSAAFVNADSVFPTASMYKLLVMYRVFQQMEAGELSPYDTITITYADMYESEPDGGLWPGDTLTVAEALESMITVSSNSAAFALVRTVGGWSQIVSAAEELGMYDTTASGGEFWSTPIDMLTFFELLASRSLVSPGASEQMIDLLLAQQTNDRIPALLPESVQVAHKTGELPGVRNDGGIVRGPGGRYIIVLMSRWANPDEAIAAEQTMSRTVYDWLGA